MRASRPECETWRGKGGVRTSESEKPWGEVREGRGEEGKTLIIQRPRRNFSKRNRRPEDGSDPAVEGSPGVDDERDGGTDRVDKSSQSNTKLDG